MTAQPLIAVVEDDAEIRDLLTAYLAKEGYDVRACRDGLSLDALLADVRPDLIILDVMMPGEDGLSICRRLSAEKVAPIIILSARGDDLDRIIGLEIGADDYLAKPFNPRELAARIKAVMRRGAMEQEAPLVAQSPREVLAFETWRLDVDGRVLTDAAGAVVDLSSGEFALLAAFARRPRRVLSREQLLDLTRGPDAALVDRAIDVQLSRLRRKLGDDPRDPALIKTIRGDGYMFAADVRRER